MVDYVHLNPVRAGIVPVEAVGAFRWSSLWHYRQKERAPWLGKPAWLGEHGHSDSPAGWTEYETYLSTVAKDQAEQRRLGFDTMSIGWAIGTTGWRRAVAQEHSHLALQAGAAQEEIRWLRETRWADALSLHLRQAGKTTDDVRLERKGAPWKRSIAFAMRAETGAAYSWLADSLNMGSAASVRIYVCRQNRGI